MGLAGALEPSARWIRTWVTKRSPGGPVAGGDHRVEERLIHYAKPTLLTIDA